MKTPTITMNRICWEPQQLVSYHFLLLRPQNSTNNAEGIQKVWVPAATSQSFTKAFAQMLPHIIIIIMKISYPAPVAPPTSCVFRRAQSAQALARIIEACTRRRESSNFQPERAMAIMTTTTVRCNWATKNPDSSNSGLFLKDFF